MTLDSTEKIPGMFGTLVICLPSAHEGGDVVLKHCGKKMVIKTSEAVQSYACWYSDVTHEVLPVRSGYRWVLTYNMAIDKHAQRPSAALKRSETRALRHTLRRWPDDGPAYLLHTLDHHYTQANVCLNNLKTRDLAQVQTLMDAAQELDFEIFLALIEKEEMGAVEYTPGSRRGYYYNPYDDEDDDDEDDEESYHHIDDIMEENYKIKSLFDLQGRLVAESLSFDTEQMLDPEAFEDLDCDEEDYEGYMGNSVRYFPVPR